MSGSWDGSRDGSEGSERDGLREGHYHRQRGGGPGGRGGDPNGFDDPESWLTPLSTDSGGKPVSNVETLPEQRDEPGNRPPRRPLLGVAAVDNESPALESGRSEDPGATPLTEDRPAGAEDARGPADGPVDGADSGGDLARDALAGARRIARPRRGRRDTDRARRTRRENLTGRNRGGYSAPGPDQASDPQPIGALLGAYGEERGWDRPLAEARFFAEWPALVGADVAAHCAPQSLAAGELRIAAESTAWATQLRLLASTLLARLVAELGPHVVTKLIITGPVGPSWKHGGWSVRGGRGPRDTYG